MSGASALAGRSVPLRQPGAGRVPPRGRRRLQVRALRALPRPRPAVELLRRRRLPHGQAGVQRRPSGHDVERPRAGPGAGQRPGHLRQGQAGQPGAVQPVGPRSLHRPLAHDGASPGPVPHLHDPRHAPGRVQRDVRRGGRTELGGLHRRGPQRRSARSLVPGLRHVGGRHRVLPLLEEQRARRPARSVRPRLGRGGACVPFRPLGARLRSLQRAVLDRSRPLPRPTLRRAARVLLHGPGPRGRTVTRCSAAALPLRRSRAGRDPDAAGQRPTGIDLRRAGQLRLPGLPHLPGPDGLSEPRLQRPHLLRRAEPGDRQSHKRDRVCRAGRALHRSAPGRPATPGLARAAGRTGLAGHRVRRHQERSHCWRM